MRVVHKLKIILSNPTQGYGGNPQKFFDPFLPHILIGAVLEASIFWLLGFVGAVVYNKFAVTR